MHGQQGRLLVRISQVSVIGNHYLCDCTSDKFYSCNRLHISLSSMSVHRMEVVKAVENAPLTDAQFCQRILQVRTKWMQLASLALQVKL